MQTGAWQSRPSGVEVGPGQAIRLYARKALGAAGTYAAIGRYSLLSLLQKNRFGYNHLYLFLALSFLHGRLHYVLQKYFH
ncbi:hypothetical protein ACFGVS_27505 [Mucilaginibacter sp. AW1-7]|uniref:hypothetical protein n=1 Tax=unclassified Mucilaginibacter TaxID=2617802 RepID=UPI0023657051|nr:hypothetical protein [Mucilaginibacter sp. KACC 22773]WDF76284.1 hypothetical protein PQ469_20560 [Mucilaginibacter sp. KACC 22773]